MSGFCFECNEPTSNHAANCSRRKSEHPGMAELRRRMRSPDCDVCFKPSLNCDCDVDAQPAQPISEQGLDAAIAQIIQMSASLGLETLLPKAREIIRALSTQPAQPASSDAQPVACGGRENCSRFPFCGCGAEPAFPERDASKPAEQQGLFRKFDVRRVDGSDRPGGKHCGCRYYVLDLDHDKHAPAAMRAYATACKETHPNLAADIESEFAASLAPDVRPSDQPIEVALMNALVERTNLSTDAIDELVPELVSAVRRSEPLSDDAHNQLIRDIQNRQRLLGRDEAYHPDTMRRILSDLDAKGPSEAGDCIHSLIWWGAILDARARRFAKELMQRAASDPDVRPSVPAQDSEGTSEFDKGWLAGLAAATGDTPAPVQGVSEPAHAEPEDEWMVNLAIVAHCSNPTVEAAAKLIMDWYQGAEPDRAEAVGSERDKALEEAASICDELSKLYTEPVGFDEGYSMASKRAASEIRALKSQQPAQADKDKP